MITGAKQFLALIIPGTDISWLDLPSDDDEDDFVPIDVGCVVPSAWPQRKLQFKCENGPSWLLIGWN